MTTLNHILEIVNVNNVIDRAALTLYLAWFSITEFWVVKGVVGSRIVGKDVRHYARWLAGALLMWALGALVITLGVNLWRDHALVLGVWLMVAGSAGTIVGNLLLIRILSVDRYGNWLWLLVGWVNLVYTILALYG